MYDSLHKTRLKNDPVQKRLRRLQNRVKGGQKSDKKVSFRPLASV